MTFLTLEILSKLTLSYYFFLLHSS